MCELGEELDREKARCEDLLRQDRHDVNQYFHALEVVLAKKRRACLDVLDKAGAEVSRAYDPLIHKVKELQVCVCSYLSSVCVFYRVSWLDFAVDGPRDTVFHRRNSWTW